MAKKNIFDNAAVQRQQTQDQISASVTGGAAKRSNGRVIKRGAVITLSISPEDKELVRLLAEKDGVSVSDLFHQWIRREWKASQEE